MKKLITMLSALTLTSSIVPLTVACINDKDKEEEVVLDLNEITSDMILNYDVAYYYNDGVLSGITTDKINGLQDFWVTSWITGILSKICTLKLVGLSKSKYEKMKKNNKISEMLNITGKATDVLQMILKGILSFEVDSRTEKNGSKKFIVTVSVKKWNDVEFANQNVKSLKEMYDSIKGKEMGKVTVTVDYESIKAIYDKQKNET